MGLIRKIRGKLPVRFLCALCAFLWQRGSGSPRLQGSGGNAEWRMGALPLLSERAVGPAPILGGFGEACPTIPTLQTALCALCAFLWQAAPVARPVGARRGVGRRSPSAPSWNPKPEAAASEKPALPSQLSRLPLAPFVRSCGQEFVSPPLQGFCPVIPGFPRALPRASVVRPLGLGAG